MICLAPRDKIIEHQEDTARLLSVTVKDNSLETQEDDNSTLENMMDDDALYEQSDYGDEQWDSDPESDFDSDNRSAPSELGRPRPIMEPRQVDPTVHRQFSPRRPVRSDSESETTTNKAVRRSTAGRYRSQQQSSPPNLVEETTTAGRLTSRHEFTPAVRQTSRHKFTPKNLDDGVKKREDSAVRQTTWPKFTQTNLDDGVKKVGMNLNLDDRVKKMDGSAVGGTDLDNGVEKMNESAPQTFLKRQPPPPPSAPQAPHNPGFSTNQIADQEGDSKTKSSITKKGWWSEESRTTKTNNQIRV